MRSRQITVISLYELINTFAEKANWEDASKGAWNCAWDGREVFTPHYDKVYQHEQDYIIHDWNDDLEEAWGEPITLEFIKAKSIKKEHQGRTYFAVPLAFMVEWLRAQGEAVPDKGDYLVTNDVWATE